MGTKIKFTKAHLKELKELFVKISMKGKALQGKFAANSLNPYELLHNTQVTTLNSLRSGLKKEIEAYEAENDEFTVSEGQNRKNEEKKDWARYLYLLIGYKRWKEQEADNRKKLSEKRAELKKLEDDNKSPAEKIKDLQKEIDDMAGPDGGDDEDEFIPAE
jgi:cell division protein FtsB